MGHVIDVPTLHAALAGGRPVRLLDVRWRLDVPEGRPGYLAAHIPGAVYVDLERELSRAGHPEEGRFPLPALAELEAAARRWGIDDGDLVVAYDDNDAIAASRAWWLLRRRGVDIRVLDGGIRAWVHAGLPVDVGDRVPRPGTVRLGDADPGVASIHDAARAPTIGVLIDVRAPEHYRGQANAGDPAAGHIPGALNLPTVSHIGRDGSLRSPDEVRGLIRAIGADADRDIVLYCSVGIASAHSALAFAEAGIDTRVYTGAWSQWSRTRGRPIAVGRTPADTFQGW